MLHHEVVELQWQQKATEKEFLHWDSSRMMYKRGWQFSSVKKAYEGMLVVCSCKGDGFIWIEYGTVLN